MTTATANTETINNFAKSLHKSTDDFVFDHFYDEYAYDFDMYASEHGLDLEFEYDPSLYFSFWFKKYHLAMLEDVIVH